jgi:hypothetical protein
MIDVGSYGAVLSGKYQVAVGIRAAPLLTLDILRQPVRHQAPIVACENSTVVLSPLLVFGGAKIGAPSLRPRAVAGQPARPSQSPHPTSASRGPHPCAIRWTRSLRTVAQSVGRDMIKESAQLGAAPRVDVGQRRHAS